MCAPGSVLPGPCPPWVNIILKKLPYNEFLKGNFYSGASQNCKFTYFVLTLVTLWCELSRKKKYYFGNASVCSQKWAQQEQQHPLSPPSQKCSPRQWLLQQFSHALAHSQTGDRHQRTQGDRLEVALAVSGFPAGLLLSNLSTLSMLHGCHSATEGSHLSEWSLCILSHETKGQHDLETMFFSWKSLLEIIHIGP